MGTFLMGWDNLMPEFNVGLNLTRNLFGTWLHYRGLGLFDGQSHVAATLHTLLVGLLSIIEPQSFIRYTIILGLFLLGMVGMYALVQELLGKHKYLSVFTALFYGFNPAIIQLFYTPFEPFAFHFAAIPWIAWALYRGRKYLFIFLLSTPQFFVPTLLFPTLILIVSLARKRIVPVIAGFILINAFWLLPYVVGVFHNAPVIASAKINQMSSNDIYLRNHAFGDIKSVLLLHSFPLNFEDFNASGNPIFIMENWRNYITQPFVLAVSWLFAGLAVMGFFLTIRSRKLLPIGIVTALAFLFLANNTPVLSTLNSLIRLLPFVGEALRVPFTKFIVLYTFGYSIFIALSIKALKHQLLPIAFGLLFIFMIPALTGNFVSPLMQVSLPNDYQKTFNYFQKIPMDRRIAILPQPAYWSWKLYRFGYHGSGFIWYGLPQPILDRAFDPWSATNENYYWELSYALYSKNLALLTNVFTKYNISFVLLDENLLSFSNNRSLFIDETKTLLGKPTETFGNISVWEFPSSGFVHTSDELPSVNAYKWTDNDVAYQELGDYVAVSDNPTVTYQHRSLFYKTLHR